MMMIEKEDDVKKTALRCSLFTSLCSPCTSSPKWSIIYIFFWWCCCRKRERLTTEKKIGSRKKGESLFMLWIRRERTTTTVFFANTFEYFLCRAVEKCLLYPSLSGDNTFPEMRSANFCKILDKHQFFCFWGEKMTRSIELSVRAHANSPLLGGTHMHILGLLTFGLKVKKEQHFSRVERGPTDGVRWKTALVYDVCNMCVSTLPLPRRLCGSE